MLRAVLRVISRTSVPRNSEMQAVLQQRSAAAMLHASARQVRSQHNGRAFLACFHMPATPLQLLLLHQQLVVFCLLLEVLRLLPCRHAVTVLCLWRLSQHRGSS